MGRYSTLHIFEPRFTDSGLRLSPRNTETLKTEGFRLGLSNIFSSRVSSRL